MTKEEAQEAIKSCIKTGAEHDEIIEGFYFLFADDEITFDELETLVNTSGYKINKKFKKLPIEKQKTIGYEYLTNESDNGNNLMDCNVDLIDELPDFLMKKYEEED